MIGYMLLLTDSTFLLNFKDAYLTPVETMLTLSIYVHILDDSKF